MTCATLLVTLLLHASPTAPDDSARERLHTQAMAAYKRADFTRATDLFRQELDTLNDGERGSAVEQRVREKLVLSLYSGGRKDEALDAYAALETRFPDFRFDEGKVAPSTIAYFDSHATQVTASPPRRTDITPVVSTTPAAAPALEPLWHWYYLAPLGIGQFAAHSPVRGSLLLVSELGFLAMDVVGAVLYQQQIAPEGYARNLSQAHTGQLIMDIGFFGALTAFAVGLIDGAAFEHAPTGQN